MNLCHHAESWFSRRSDRDLDTETGFPDVPLFIKHAKQPHELLVHGAVSLRDLLKNISCL